MALLSDCFPVRNFDSMVLNDEWEIMKFLGEELFKKKKKLNEKNGGERRPVEIINIGHVITLGEKNL